MGDAGLSGERGGGGIVEAGKEVARRTPTYVPGGVVALDSRRLKPSLVAKDGGGVGIGRLGIDVDMRAAACEE